MLTQVPRFLLGLLAAIAFAAGAPFANVDETREPKRVAITFDDLPFAPASSTAAPEAVRVNAAIRGILARERVPAIGFVTEKSVQALGEDGARMVRAWAKDGFELGNHGATHADSNDLQVGEIRQEIAAGETTIAPLAKEFGRPLTWYRFAYNHLGNTEAKRFAIEQLLAERGYRLAASTIDTSDWLFDAAYRRAADDPVMRRRIEQAYLDHSRTQIRFYGELNRQVLGREPPAIMLLHMNSLNAATLDPLLAIFRSEGFRFVSLDEAQADEAYRTPPAYATRFGPMWGYRWARERGVRIAGLKEQEPPAWVQTYAETGTPPAP